MPGDQLPFVDNGSNGQGASRLSDWFDALSARLARVVVINRSWEKALTPTLLQQTPSCRKPPVGIVLDPPYLTAGRSKTLYGSDVAGTSDDAATASWRWALEHGERYRIVYFAHLGDFEVPDGWTAETLTLRGVTLPDRRHRRDLALFSPACESVTQNSLRGLRLAL